MTAASRTFSNDGKYLFFISNRDFNPIYSWTEWNHAYTDMAKIYFITLAKTTPNPFAPENDEVSVKTEGSENGDKPKNDAAKDNSEDKKDAGSKDKTVKIDLDGIMDRIVGLPIDAGSYFGVYRDWR